MESQLTLRVRMIPKGSNVAIFPVSTKFGDPLTAYGQICRDGKEVGAFEISDPFQAVIEDFDGKFIHLASEKYGRFKLAIREVRDIQQMK